MPGDPLAAALHEASVAMARAAASGDLDEFRVLLERRGRMLADAKASGLGLEWGDLDAIRAADAAAGEQLRALSAQVGLELDRLREARRRLRRRGDGPEPRFLSERA